jgi:hypothetical protein
MSEDKLSIKSEMSALDRKNRKFYDSLTDDEKKKFSPFLMIRYGSTVAGNADLQSYYLMSCNERLNKHFFDINTTQHKKLQWLLATTVSPDMGNQFHQWLPTKKKESGDSKSKKFLRELRPELGEDEITLLAELNSKDDLKQYAKSLGWDDKRIKSNL